MALLYKKLQQGGTTKRTKVSNEFSDFGTRLLNAVGTLGTSAIGDAIEGVSPKAADFVEKYTLGAIPHTSEEQLQANRSDNDSKWGNRVNSTASAMTNAGAVTLIGAGMNRAAGSIVSGEAKQLLKSGADRLKSLVGTKQIKILPTKEGYSGKFLSDKQRIGDGSESTVYRKGNNVYKIQEPYNNDAIYDSRVRHGLTINEIEGGVKTKLHGLYKTDQGVRNPIFKQKFVKGRPATEQEIENHFIKNGYEKIGRNSYSKSGRTVADVDPDNVIVDSEGKINIIDADIY